MKKGITDAPFVIAFASGAAVVAGYALFCISWVRWSARYMVVG